jgi:Fe-S-cluster containining protein
MDHLSSFSYLCKECGRCCHDKVITLSPYDVIRIARVAGISTGEAIQHYTIRRGAVLKFNSDGRCVALEGTRCAIHRGRPLACRLYPLGLEHTGAGAENFVKVEPAAGSLGVYGDEGTVRQFLQAQRVPNYLAMNACYADLIPLFRERVAALVDFVVIEPREFWRVAVREALAEADFDPNPLIGAMFDADRIGCGRASSMETVAAHVRELDQRIRREMNPVTLAAAAVMLAVSLGYAPGEVTRPP